MTAVLSAQGQLFSSSSEHAISSPQCVRTPRTFDDLSALEAGEAREFVSAQCLRPTPTWSLGRINRTNHVRPNKF